MSKNRLIFFIIFAGFHVFLFFFSLYVDNHRDNLQFLISLQSKIWLLKYGSLLGLVLILINIIWDRRLENAHRKEKDQLNHEINTLKAKLFDLQEADKSRLQQPPEPPQKR